MGNNTIIKKAQKEKKENELKKRERKLNAE